MRKRHPSLKAIHKKTTKPNRHRDSALGKKNLKFIADTQKSIKEENTKKSIKEETHKKIKKGRKTHKKLINY